MRDELLCEVKGFSSHPIVNHQQPTTQPCLYGMKAIADGRLGDLSDKRMSEPEQQVLELTVSIELHLEQI